MKAYRFFIQISIILFYNSLMAQSVTEEKQTSFGGKISNPIRIEVLKKDNVSEFYAVNRSFYPYRLTIQFTEISNMSPESLNESFIVYPGKKKLFSLTVRLKDIPYDYQYTTSSRIGIPSKNIDPNHPYLVPIGVGNHFEFVSYGEEDGLFFKNFFGLKPGDTIYSMRKGRVVASPNMYFDSDRISNRPSLEILHQDGTIMVYDNIDPDNTFVKPTNTVYPGQALGIIKGDLPLQVYLYSIKEDGQLNNLNIGYYTSATEVQYFSKSLQQTPVIYPDEVVLKEMSKSEIKKFKKRKTKK